GADDPRRMALPAMAGFREHGEEIHDVGPRTTRVRLDVHDPRTSARHRDAGEFDDEPGQVAGPQSGPGPSTVNGIGRVQISAWECGDGLEHGPTVTHQEIEVGHRREADRRADHTVASRADVNPCRTMQHATLNKVNSRTPPARNVHVASESPQSREPGIEIP